MAFPTTEEGRPMNSNVQQSKQQLLDDFGKVVSDAEGLLKAVGSAPGEKAAEMRASVQKSLDSAKDRLREIQGAAVEKTTAAARAADEYVHDNPWPMIGAAALFGFVLGLVVKDRD
jgi:ElaB/YqjD/DUF883 family membrane-anchored ribosome-binding protein